MLSTFAYAVIHTNAYIRNESGSMHIFRTSIRIVGHRYK